MLEIRPETPEDHAAVREVNEQAFGRRDEADLVEALRRTADPYVSLVAEVEGRIVGHICFSPVEIEGEGKAPPAMGLAPMAVRPDHQRHGVGTALVRAGLQACRRLGAAVVVVLGHPAYYPRFGFAPARDFGLQCEYDVPPEAFMVLALQPGAHEDIQGVVTYHPAFRDIG